MKIAPHFAAAAFIAMIFSSPASALADHHAKSAGESAARNEKNATRVEKATGEATSDRKPGTPEAGKDAAPQRRLFHAEEAVRHLQQAGLKNEAEALKSRINSMQAEIKKVADDRKALVEARKKEVDAFQKKQGVELQKFRGRIQDLKKQLESVQQGLSELTAQNSSGGTKGRPSSDDPVAGALAGSAPAKRVDQ